MKTKATRKSAYEKLAKKAVRRGQVLESAGDSITGNYWI